MLAGIPIKVIHVIPFESEILQTGTMYYIRVPTVYVQKNTLRLDTKYVVTLEPVKRSDEGGVVAR
jgi:hypothetical protein